MPRPKKPIDVALLAAARDGDISNDEAARRAGVSGRLFGIRLYEFMHGQAQQRSRTAMRACLEWLSSCRRIGFKKSELDELNHIWWRWHDEQGNLLSSPRRFRGGH